MYKNQKTKIKITHLVCGNSFYQTPNNHLRKSCPFCRTSKGQLEIAEILKQHRINFEVEKSFDGLLGLGGGRLRFDFFLPEQGVLIEFDGEQHFHFMSELMDEKTWERLKQHDKMKTLYAKANGIKLIRLSYLDRPITATKLAKALTLSSNDV